MSDIKLHFREAGDGDTLILLHGNGENSSYFSNQLDFFARDRRVIAVDTRGHGDSPRGTAPFTLAQFADDLHDFFAENGIGKADILGFSDGANIAMLFAMKYPECVNRLILNGGNLFPRGVKASVQLPIELGYRIASIFAKGSEKALRRAEMLRLMVNEPHIDPEELHSLHMRTLVIAGTKDMIRKSHTQLIFENLPNAQLVFIPGDHFIAAKQPEAFNAAAAAFLKSQKTVSEE